MCQYETDQWARSIGTHCSLHYWLSWWAAIVWRRECINYFCVCVVWISFGMKGCYLQKQSIRILLGYTSLSMLVCKIPLCQPVRYWQATEIIADCKKRNGPHVSQQPNNTLKEGYAFYAWPNVKSAVWIIERRSTPFTTQLSVHLGDLWTSCGRSSPTQPLISCSIIWSSFRIDRLPTKLVPASWGSA